MHTSESLQMQDDIFSPVFLKLQGAHSVHDLTQYVRQGVTHIYEGQAIPQALARESLFFLHLHPQTAFNIDLTLLLRAFCNRNTELSFKDHDMVLTAIFEGWSNALIWGTLEMPPQEGGSRTPEFERVLKQQLNNPLLASRYLTLAMKRKGDKVRVYIRDQGIDKNFTWNEACIRSRESYKGLTIIHNCCDGVAFDDVHKVLRMEFRLI